VFKKGIITVAIMIALEIIVNPASFSHADDVQQTNKIDVKFTLDESLVDLPLDELKKKDITIYKNKKGRYIVFVIMDDGQQKMQVISGNEAQQLGYIENIADNLPQNLVVIIDKDSVHQFIVTIIDRQGNEVKQVISEVEAIQLGYREDFINLPKSRNFIIEKTADGRYLITLTEENGTSVKQVITKEEALKLGFVENESSSDIAQVGSKDSAKQSGLLPETATNFYNMLLIGWLLFILGLTLFFARRKKSSSVSGRT